MMKKQPFKIVLLFLVLQIVATGAFAQNLFKVEVQGSGQPMLFIPGLYSTGKVWDSAVNYYSQDHTCYVFTLAGFGDVPPVNETPYLKTMRGGIIKYVRKHHLKNAVLVGHSMGGFLALWAAAEAPDLFSAVVSVDGPPFLPNMTGLSKERAASVAKKIRKGMASATEKESRKRLKRTASTMVQDSSDQQMIVKMGLEADPETQGEVMYELFTTDLRDSISTIKAPVLVLGSWIGYKDYGATAESVRKKYEKQFKDVNNVTIKLSDEALHFIFLDQPEWFRQQVDAFLKESNQPE